MDDNCNISNKERLRIWKEFPSPKPTWGAFKILLREGGTPQEILVKWRKRKLRNFG